MRVILSYCRAARRQCSRWTISLPAKPTSTSGITEPTDRAPSLEVGRLPKTVSRLRFCCYCIAKLANYFYNVTIPTSLRQSLDFAFNKVLFKIFGALSKDTEDGTGPQIIRQRKLSATVALTLQL